MLVLILPSGLVKKPSQPTFKRCRMKDAGWKVWAKICWNLVTRQHCTVFNTNCGCQTAWWCGAHWRICYYMQFDSWCSYSFLHVFALDAILWIYLSFTHNTTLQDDKNRPGSSFWQNRQADSKVLISDKNNVVMSQKEGSYVHRLQVRKNWATLKQGGTFQTWFVRGLLGKFVR